jgi:CubicO group peptidase (beta-lactamase class C family)
MRVVLALMVVCATGLSSRAADLPRSTPETEGISSTALLKFIEAADEIDAMNSVMLVRHGKVVAEGWWAPYAPADRHMLYSLSKSFTSTAVGMAIAEGKLSLDDTVLSFFPDDAPAEPSDNLKAMRVRDLLSMSTGHHDADLQQFSFTATDEPLTKKFLALPVAHKPGTHFVYNTPATYMCSAIVQKVTGEKVADYLRPRLFEPLGIENPKWGDSPQGVTLGGYGLNIRTEDIAKFGQLYLQKGRWQDRELLPTAWVEAATSRQVSNGSDPASDWEQGYGYQFWRCRHGFYRGDGAFGQYCIVMPEYDAVLAITSGVRDMQAVMSLAWEKLLPAMESEPLPENAVAQEKLQASLAALRIRPPIGAATSPLAAKISGKTYQFPANERNVDSITFEFGDGEATIVTRGPAGERQLTCGYDAWPKVRTDLVRGPDLRSSLDPEQGLAASGAWTAGDTYTVKLCLFETPFYLTTTYRFEGDAVTVNSEYNVAFGETKLPQLAGKKR